MARKLLITGFDPFGAAHVARRLRLAKEADDRRHRLRRRHEQ